MIQHGEDEARFSTRSRGTATITVGTRLPRPHHSEVKQLLVPVKDILRTGFVRTKIREYFERTYHESERLEVHFVRNKCYVKVARPVADFSDQGRLQWHFKEKNLEFQIAPGRKAEVMEG